VSVKISYAADINRKWPWSFVQDLHRDEIRGWWWWWWWSSLTRKACFQPVQHSSDMKQHNLSRNALNMKKYTCAHHANGRLVHHADDSDGHADPLSVQVEKHEETDDGKTETRGAEKWSRLYSPGPFIFLRVDTRYKQTTDRSDFAGCNIHPRVRLYPHYKRALTPHRPNVYLRHYSVLISVQVRPWPLTPDPDYLFSSGSATLGRARSNDPARRSTVLVQALLSPALAACVLRATTKKKVVNFFEEKVHPGELAGKFSDLEMTWLFYCAGAATAFR